MDAGLQHADESPPTPAGSKTKHRVQPVVGKNLVFGKASAPE
jgi:hypothetical protein